MFKPIAIYCQQIDTLTLFFSTSQFLKSEHHIRTLSYKLNIEIEHITFLSLNMFLLITLRFSMFRSSAICIIQSYHQKSYWSTKMLRCTNRVPSGLLLVISYHYYLGVLYLLGYHFLISLTSLISFSVHMTVTECQYEDQKPNLNTPWESYTLYYQWLQLLGRKPCSKLQVDTLKEDYLIWTEE